MEGTMEGGARSLEALRVQARRSVNSRRRWVQLGDRGGPSDDCGACYPGVGCTTTQAPEAGETAETPDAEGQR